jgi:iron complex outermembrane receptor protein
VATGVGRRTYRVLPISLIMAALGTAPAAAATHRFAIAAKPVTAALIDFALQSDVSIGGSFHCDGDAAPLQGDFTTEAGLTKLLAPTNCSFRRVAPDTMLIFNRAPYKAPTATPTPKTVPRPVAAARAPTVEMAPEIIVTATKRRALAQELPYAVSLVGTQALRETGAVDANDIAAGEATIAATNLGPGRDKVLIRGLSDGSFTGRTQSTVGLFLDDTPITYNAPDPDLRLTDVQSVEVLRGPQGSLYGDGSMSGVYRIITHKPLLNTLSANLMVGGGETEGGAPSTEVEGVVNLPLLHDVAALRMAGYHEIDGGYIDNVTLKAKNIDASTRLGGRSTLRVLAGANWTVTAGAAYQAIRTSDTQYVSRSEGRLNHANAISESSGNTFLQGFLTFERSGVWADLRSSTSVVSRQITSRTDASTALFIFGGTGGASGAYDEPISINTVVEDAVLSSSNIGPWRWLIGGYGSVTREDTHPIVSGIDTHGRALRLYEEQRTDKLGVAAIYGETSYALTRRLTVTAGLRASETGVATTSVRTASARHVSQGFKGAEQFDGLSPKLAADYQLSKSVRAYALASDGRRAGGFNTGAVLFTKFTDLPSGSGLNRRFQGDELWNFEVGIKSDSPNHRLTVTSALFYNDWRNIQTDQYQASGLSYTTNAGDGTNYGLEADIGWRPTQNLLIEANALIDRPQLTRPRPGFVSSPHAGLPGVPDLTAGARATYRWPIDGNLTGLVSAQAQYVGTSHVTFDPTLSPLMGGYVLDKISCQIEGRRWRLAAYLLNATGERGDTFTYGNPFKAGLLTETTPQRPRTLRLTLSVGF